MHVALFDGDPEEGGTEVPFTRRPVTLEAAPGEEPVVVEAVRWRLARSASHMAILSPAGDALFVYDFPKPGKPGDRVGFGARTVRVPVPVLR
jgi:hypothetical protein